MNSNPPLPSEDQYALQSISSPATAVASEGSNGRTTSPVETVIDGAAGQRNKNHLNNNHDGKQNGHAPALESTTPKGSETKMRKIRLRAKCPNGGFGWMVVFSSFMCNIIVDGIIFSFGFLLPEISTEFNENKATTAWIGSLQTGFYLIVGPLVSAFSEIYDCRIITVLGTFLTAIGFVLSYFAENVLTLYLTFGLLGGIGFGFVFLPAIVTVGQYFDSKRATATGVAVCGSGVGTFILPPIIQLIIKNFGWRVCILWMAGITLLCAFFGSFFKSLTRVIEVPEEEDAKQQQPLLQRIKAARAQEWTQSDENLSQQANNKQQTGESATVQTGNGTAAATNGNVLPLSDVLNIIPLNDTAAGDVSKMSSSKGSSIAGGGKGGAAGGDSNLLSTRGRTRSERRNTLTTRDEMMYSNLSLVVPPPNRSISSLNLNQVESGGAGGGGGEGTTGNSVIDDLLNKGWTLVDEPRGFFAGFNLLLLKRPSFILLSISGFLCLVGFFIPFIYISDRAKLLGCSPEQCAFILSCIGVANTLGRVFCGWASDNPRVNALVMNNLALTVGGVATILSPIIFNTYNTLIAYAAIFGFSVATFATLRSVITVELLGLEKLNSAFGLLLLFQGLAVTIGSPIAGWFYDITGSYDYSFYLSGAAIALSGAMCYPLNAIARWEKKIFKEEEEVQA